jgi:hypothetical protein
MRAANHKPTLRGVAPSADFDWDDVPAEAGRLATVTCPPPSIAPSRPPARYSFIARRQTLSMLVTPLPADEAPASGRRRTLRLCLASETAQQYQPSVRESAGGS